MEDDTGVTTMADDTGISTREDDNEHFNNKGKPVNTTAENNTDTTTDEGEQEEEHNRVSPGYCSGMRLGARGVTAQSFFPNVIACSEDDCDRSKSGNTHVFTDGRAVPRIPYRDLCMIPRGKIPPRPSADATR